MLSLHYRKDAGVRTLCGRLLKCLFLTFLSHRGAETPTRAETADTVRYSSGYDLREGDSSPVFFS